MKPPSWLTPQLQRYIFLFVLFIVSIAPFGPTLKNPYLADDYIWAKYVAGYDSFDQFAQNAFALKEADFRYRPLMPTAVRLCYQISGHDPFCTHLTSFIFHFLNVLLIGHLSYLLTKNKIATGAAMLFFAVYFPHVVTVVWMSDLGNPLAAFFMLLTVILFYQFITGSKYLWWGVRNPMLKQLGFCYGDVAVVPGGLPTSRRATGLSSCNLLSPSALPLAQANSPSRHSGGRF